MLEVELKSPCDDPERVERALVELGAQPVGSRQEIDCYYNHPARDFGTTDEALRLRRVQGRCVLTYKGPKQGGRAKSRVEHEVEVADYDRTEAVLLALGFVRYGMVRKTRKLFMLDDITACLDSVEGLGDFVELELVGAERQEAESRLAELAARLGLSRFVRESYLELLMRGRETGGG